MSASIRRVRSNCEGSCRCGPTAGKTIFFSSHDLDEVQRICNRIALIDRGEIRLAGELKTSWRDGRARNRHRFGAAFPNRWQTS